MNRNLKDTSEAIDCCLAMEVEAELDRRQTRHVRMPIYAGVMHRLDEVFTGRVRDGVYYEVRLLLSKPLLIP